ncbi:uncharacterized protein LOC111040623 [Myzus persicae]|uniref:uncharacterized protein LOC111040623 n=1 Tax=Myzus persicae TaxID=13164 RepID=UPI000B932E23|nr:uncharacterized protein LOC111040623 [Myzus persicae]
MSNVDVLEQLQLVLKPDMPDRRLVCVEETDTAKADMILSFYMWYAFTKTDLPVQLIGTRDSYGHYQNVGLKFHYNLLSMSNQSRFEYVDSVECINDLFNYTGDLLKRYPTGPTYMVVDDISSFLLLGATLSDIITFLMYVKHEPRLRLVIGCWKHKDDESAKRLASAISHTADIRVALAPLVTGFSNTATGTMRITTHESQCGIEEVSYLYKLADNGLKLTLNSGTV